MHRKEIVQLFETIVILVLGNVSKLPTVTISRQAYSSGQTNNRRAGTVHFEFYCNDGPYGTMNITIYHNPQCSKSRKSLEFIRDAGFEPRIVEYLQEAPDAATILQLAQQLNIPVAGLLRRNEELFTQASDLPDLADDIALAAWLTQNPRVIERPIVVNEDTGTAVIGRPAENVPEFLKS